MSANNIDEMLAEREQAAAADRQLKAQASLERERQEQALERQRQEWMRRIRDQAQATVQAPRDTGQPSASYARKIVEQIRGNIALPSAPRNAERRSATVYLKIASNGQILSSSVVASSGHAEWDENVLRAFAKMGSLPHDIDGSIPKILVQHGVEITVTE